MIFCKESDFRDTQIGKLPKSWDVVKLKALSVKLIGGGTPSTTKKNYWNGEIPWMTSAHITGRMVKNGQRHISKEGLENSASKIVPKGNLLVATRVGIGKAAVNMLDIAISQDLTGVVIDKEKVSPEFLYWFLINSGRKLKALAQGSTIKGVLREDLGRMLIPYPSISEQNGIVEVLSCVDLTIQKTDEVIAKTERLKKGLMQQLLTKGIDHKEFKDTEIGKIPKEWDIKTVDNLFTVETGTTPSTLQKDYWNQGTVNWITPTDLSKLNGEIHIEKSERLVTEKALGETNLTKMPKGSIILSTRAPVGYVAVLKQDAAFNQGCKGLVQRGANKIFPEFYAYYLLSKKKLLQSLSGGSTFLELSKDMLCNIKVPHMTIAEQSQISAILLLNDQRIWFERKQKEKLERIKQGLMDLLLTGKVRVRMD